MNNVTPISSAHGPSASKKAAAAAAPKAGRLATILADIRNANQAMIRHR